MRIDFIFSSRHGKSADFSDFDIPINSSKEEKEKAVRDLIDWYNTGELRGYGDKGSLRTFVRIVPTTEDK